MRTRGGTGPALAVAALLLVFAALMLLRPLPPAVGQPAAYAVQSLTALALCRVLVRRARDRLRRARLLLAGAVASGALAGVLALLLHVVTGEAPPVPSIADAVHFAFLPLAVLGLLSFPTSDTEPGSVQRSLLDGVVAALALWFLAYALLLEPMAVGQGLALPAALTALLYPTADLFVLGTLVGVLPRVAPAARTELAVVGGGFALYCLSDVAYSVLQAAGTYRADSGVSLLAEAGLVLMLLGARSRRASVPSPTAVRWLRALAQVPVVLVLGVTAVNGLRGGGLRGPLLACALAMTVALLARQGVGTRDRRLLTARLQAREELFRSLVNGGSDLITLTDATGTVLWSSPAVARTVGRTVVEGQSLLESVHPDDREQLVRAAVAARADPDGQAETLCRLESVSGWRWMQVRFQDRLDDPAVGGLICNARDVHDRHLLEQQLSHAAYHDALTGLGNLARARELLDAAMTTTAATPARDAAVLLVDLDGFKAVNDTFGHARGDALLGEVSARLTACLRQGDELVRLGGDEFLLVVDDARHADVLARRVLEQLRAPLVVGDTPLSVSASIGTARAADAGSPDELLRNADLAMYASKDAGRDRCTAYEPGMHERAAHRMHVSRGLREALDRDLLALHYQPIVRLADGELVGAEALLRWEDPVRGAVDPTEFISVAEESGLIGDLDVWVLDRVCRDLAGWRAAGVVVPRISLNVSRRHMTGDLPRLVEQTLRRYRLDGASLCLEVTESAVVADAEVASRALTRVRELGVTVALDDFGTGQSSLSQLARLPVDTVKIDMGFTQQAVVDAAARRLLLAVLRVCRSLDLPVVAEGIEDAPLAALLDEAGCEFGQGWHFGRPRPALEFAAVLDRDEPPALQGSAS